MRGYFAIGVERVSKAGNLGALMRTAHAFGASFVFTVKPQCKVGEAGLTDTSESFRNLPYYPWDSVDAMALPKGCQLVGIELLDEAIDLPSFRHPRQCAYVLGPERGNLSEALVARCDFVVKIPTRFCVNLSVAGAVVMYDRIMTLGRHAPRPVRAGGPTEALPPTIHGGPVLRQGRPD